MAKHAHSGPQTGPRPPVDPGQAVLVVSLDGLVLWSNEAARHLLSTDDVPLSGQPCFALLSGIEHPCQAGGTCPLEAALHSGRPAACTLHTRPGHAQPLRAALHPVPGPQGEVAEFVVTIGSPLVSARGRSPRRREHDELALLFTLSEMDKRGCSVSEVTELLARNLCYSLGLSLVSIYLPSRDARQLILEGGAIAAEQRQTVHQALGGSLPNTTAIPQQRDSLLWAAFRSSRPTLLAGEQIRQCLLEHTQSPATRQLLASLQPSLDIQSLRLIPLRTQGRPIGLVALAGTVPLGQEDRERAQRSIDTVAALIQRIVVRDQRRQLQQRTAAILSSVQEGVLGLDTDGRISFANPAAIEWLGWQQAQVVGSSLQDLRALPPAPDTRPLEESNPILAAVLSGLRLHQQETELVHRNGNTIEVAVSVSPLEESGEIRGAVVTFAEIGQRKHVDRQLRRSLEHLRLSLAGTVQALGRMAETRDPYTAGHQQRVAKLAHAMATSMGLGSDAAELVRLAALVHDIGKIAIPVELLTKPGRLAAHEFELMRTHTTVGWEILQEAHLHQAIAAIARQHHERLDGSGYPDGIEGTAILREARIIAVADTVEAMASHRPYRPSLGVEEALAEIFKQRGKHYDPEAVDACIRLFRVRGFTFEE
jgi:PAS domain S-box-containing protein/putative nucleotidyltransferase with HDIG domain